MRWPWRRNAQVCDPESKELAKKQLEVATAIEESSAELAHEHRWLLYANHFGPNAAKALREAPR